MNQLKIQNQRLLQQNQTLKQSLEQLIAVNTELTQSIQEFSSTNALNDRIVELQNQNKSLKTQLNNTLRKMQAQQKNNNNEDDLARENQQLTEIVRNLMQKSNMTQNVYENQINKLAEELQTQKRHSEQQIKKLQEVHAAQIEEYQQVISQLRHKNQHITTSVERKVLEKSQQLHHQELQKKHMKVSTTIEDLRNVLSSQIQQKDRIIHIYQNLIQKLKQKIKQKF